MGIDIAWSPDRYFRPFAFLGGIRKEIKMKYLSTNPVSAVCVMYGAANAALLSWITYRPEIQDALRTMQAIIFWWQQ